ncbi:CaiB/BaiF CoA transferase family protein [Anaeroarcus burkinensis]|uniref:CaiB/BaiF CoA transferase family protein n=1 Tax=Anaeroarcus burkinensis TaxID=82376 RepID=UPI000419880D|nr:CoA transferase [Anaeroarcus burkinensis]
MITAAVTPGALQGIRILDLTRVLAGPYSAQILADMGADVIKIEQPGRGDDARGMGPYQNEESIYFITNNRNKKGVTLNLKSPKGKEIFLDLVRNADVVMENYRPGTMEKLGLGYDVLKEINPKIIYGSISGFGHYGRYTKRPGYDIIAQAMSGLMSTTGWPTSGPTRTGTPLGDVLAGLWQAIGILGAIQARNNTGLGQKVDIALVDSAVATMGNINMLYLSEGRIPGRIGNRYESAYPYDSFTCTDGSCVIGVANNKLWHLFCDIMEQPELAEDEKFCNVPDRVENHEELHRIVSEWAAVHTMTEVVDSCLNAGVPAAPIYNTAQVKADPHIAGDREMFVEQDHPKAGKVVVTGSPLKMSGTPVDLTAPAPTLGQHNDEVYGEVLGLNAQQVASLKSEGII